MHAATPWLRLAGIALLASAATGSAGETPSAGSSAGVRLDGFETSPHFGEQVRSFEFDGGVKIHINAPAADGLDRRRPLRLILYAVPNGNTIAETVGRRPGEGVHWRYNIQHIGAQTRRLREVLDDEHIVVAYAEAEGRSWPAWRRRFEDSPQRIAALIETIRGHFSGFDVILELTGHSGGGALIFSYLDGQERIPGSIRRISFLDSNYSYSDGQGHGDKLLAWLQGGGRNCLSVIAYDDRNITLDGKPVIGPDGGTFRRTHDMLRRLRRDVELDERPLGDCIQWRGLGGRIDVILHTNPHNRILHTALVGDMNGFIQAMTSGTPWEGQAATFNGPVAYSRWIQPE